MTRDRIDSYAVSKTDNPDQEALSRELFRRTITERCIRNNLRGPTAKKVMVSAWNAHNERISFGDSYLPPQSLNDTDLSPLHFLAIRFQIWWKVLYTGSTVWSTTGPVT